MQTPTPLLVLRAARPDEAPRLREIEHAAAQLFLSTPYAALVQGELPPLAHYEHFCAQGWAWVAIQDEAIAAFALARPLADCLFVVELDVDPAFARRGLGAALLERLAALGRGFGLAQLGLTTFVDVPWNAPYYERLGFRALAPQEVPAPMAEVLAREIAAGLPAGSRVGMLRAL